MDARLDYSSSEILQKFAKHINAAGGALLAQSALPPATQNLVLIRASQINGCSVCLDIAARHYDADQLAALTCTIALINTYNRLNVISRNQGGDYQPGQWG